MGIFWITTIDNVKEGLLDALRYGAAASCSDGQTVELADGGDFGCCAAEEGFVGDIDFVAGDAFFYHFDSQVGADVQHGVAGDAV